jgi:hypothetical protein
MVKNIPLHFLMPSGALEQDIKESFLGRHPPVMSIDADLSTAFQALEDRPPSQGQILLTVFNLY